MNFSAFSISHKGLVRLNNQDGCWYHTAENFCFAAVADGLGGHACGEKASEIVINTFESSIPNISASIKSPDTLPFLGQRIKECNSQIFAFSDSNPSCHGLGTTIVCCIAVGDNLLTANLGDSRFYHIRKNEIIQKTKDHTLLQELIDEGTVPAESAYYDPRQHILSRCLGSYQNSVPNIDYYDAKLNSLDTILLCSDGLYNMISDMQIKSVVSDKYKAINDRADHLLQIALDNGGTDNITFIIIDIDE